MSDAEVITTAVVAAWHLSGNRERTRALLGTTRYIPRMRSRNRLSRRLQALQAWVNSLFQVLGEVFKQRNARSVYIIDSFPITACDNIRIPPVKRYQKARDRGYTASQRRYFYGLKSLCG